MFVIKQGSIGQGSIVQPFQRACAYVCAFTPLRFLQNSQACLKSNQITFIVTAQVPW